MTYRLLLLCALLVLPASRLRAQPAARAAFASDEAAAQHKARFVAAVQKAGFRRPADTYYYKYRIDITKEAALRRARLDLREMERGVLCGAPGYQEASLLADLVVRGTVVSVVTDSSRRVCYHSTYKVRVAETWQGLAADTLTFREMSGPLGKGRVSYFGAPQIVVGEEAILHLMYIDFAEIQEAEKLGLTNCVTNAAPGALLLLLHTPVQGDWVLSSDGRRRVVALADLRRNLRRIAALLDKEHFYQKAF